MTAAAKTTENTPRESTPRENAPGSIDDIIGRYPALTAHMICESLGHFTPRAAANAVLQHQRGEPHYCEWYIDAAGWSGEELVEFGRRTVERAFRHRRNHRGYMAEYARARALVEQERRGAAPIMFSSWQ